MLHKSLALVGLTLSGTGLLVADFQYQETTKITGGLAAMGMKMAAAFSKQAREPNVSTVYVKGNRKATISAHHGSIVDLDKETITNVDFDKKTYTVMTFEQMKKAIEDGMREAQKQKGEPTPAGDAKADVNFKASVRETGKSQPVSGLNSKEFILTLVMEATDKNSGQKGTFGMTNDMWMAADIPGYQEVREFDRRMAMKMAGMLAGAGVDYSAVARPEMMKGMQEMAKEMAKLKGTPVMQVMRVGTTGDGTPVPAASEAPDAAKTPDIGAAVGKSASNAASDAATDSALSAAAGRMGRIGGLAGGLGGLGGMRRKKTEEQPAPQQKAEAANAPAAGAAIIMETTTELTSFSSAPVDGSNFSAPAGFKQVEPQERRGRK